jgi:hypothetical protein
LLGILTGPFRGDRLRRVVDGVLAARAHTDDAPSESGSATTPTSSIRVVLLGAQESDVSVLRLLYRVQQIDLRLVYDPDPEAFGLSLAQNLGIATTSGELALDTVPDAIILARGEL